MILIQWKNGGKFCSNDTEACIVLCTSGIIPGDLSARCSISDGAWSQVKLHSRLMIGAASPLKRASAGTVAFELIQRLFLSLFVFVMLLQAAFTAKELREITKLEGVQLHVPQESLVPTEVDQAEMDGSRAKKRVFGILQDAAKAPKKE